MQDTGINSVWKSWYKGDVAGFHQYKYYNGESHLDMKRKSLNMAKQVCETWASLLFNEKCDIVIPEKSQDVLNDIFVRQNFWVKINEGIEKSFAQGYGALVVNVRDLQVGTKTGVLNKDKSYVTTNYIESEFINPITIENKQIVECYFESKEGDNVFYVIHLRDENGNYIIHNYILNDKKAIEKYWVFDTKSDVPWFQIIRPFIVNNVNNNFGISVFANSIDVLKSVDTKYDSFDWEFIAGRKRLFMGVEAWNFKPDANNKSNRVPTFDPSEALYYHLPVNSDGKQIITDQSGMLRAAEHITAINSELSLLSMKCGLGEGFYKFNGSGIATATQVISENSTLYRTLKKHEILLDNALTNTVYAIIKASNNFTNAKMEEIKLSDIEIVFDDSIIEDKEAMMTRDKADVVAGLMSKEEYRMKWYGENEKDAIKNVTKYFRNDVLNKYLGALQSGALRPEEFVEYCYPDYNEEKRTEIIEYISDFLNKSGYDPYAGDETLPPDNEDEDKDVTEDEQED